MGSDSFEENASPTEANGEASKLHKPILPATTSSLDALQTADQRKVLNIVDSLRKCGIDDIISLPQLVVCGDQSSGKSSVLEAITEFPFPRRENLCTRFATEIVLRRSPKASIATKIIPDKARPAEEKEELAKFKLSITNFDDLPNLIDSATDAMGIGDISSGATRAFARDVLSIEICGPDRPQLTLVDLPGLIHSENQSQSRDDVLLVSELVERYIAESRTIVLPIISAKNDYANQIILDRVRSVDPDGSRTLGIITKPDDLPLGSESEKSFVSLARNEEKVVTFKLGWHVLKNRGFNERDHTFDQRNRSEAAFFQKGAWAELPRDNVGIESLRSRLSELLFEHIKKELPDLHTELDKKLVETTKALQRLGAQRSTVDEQRQYLVKLSMSFYDIAKAGLHGHYDAEYFADKENFENAAKQLKARRLRAMIQYMNKQFAAHLRRSGHKYTFGGQSITGLNSDDEDEGPVLSAPDAEVVTEATESTNPLNSGASDEIETPKKLRRREPIFLERQEALDWVEQNLVQTRGRELAGNFNPLLIGELFWEQSENWEDMARKHTEEISKLCTNFVSDLLQELCPEDVYARLSSNHVGDVLKQRLEHSQAELKKVIADKKLYPMTYNHYYTMTIQKLRSQRAEKSLDECIAEATSPFSYYTYSSAKTNTPVTIDRIDAKKLKKLCSERIILNMDDHSCSDALDCLYAYYKVALKAFTDNVPIQVIERHLINNLEDIFSPLTVSRWSDEEILRLASEPAGIVRHRQFLEGRKKILENGRDLFNEVLKGSG